MPIISQSTNTPVRMDFYAHHSPLPGNTGETIERTEVGRYYGSVSDSLYRDVRKIDPIGRRKDGYYKLTRVVHPHLHHFDGWLEYDSGSQITVPNRQHHKKRAFGTAAGWIPTSNSLLGTSSQAKAQLINNVVKGINEKHVSLAMFIGELDDTSKLVSRAAQRLVQAYGQVKSGRFAAAARTLSMKPPSGVSMKKHASSNYLAYSFGWMPIIDDMVGALKHLHSRGSRLVIQSRSRLTTADGQGVIPSQTTVASYGSNQDKYLISWKYNWKRERRQQVHALYRLESAFWDDANRLGFLNPLKLAWDAIPLSFVVDTFANIGEYLDNLSNSLGLEFISGAYTQDSRLSFDIVGTPSWGSVYTGGKNYSIRPGSPVTVSGQNYMLERVPLYEWDFLVSFLLRSPLSVNNAITDTALVLQRLGK